MGPREQLERELVLERNGGIGACEVENQNAAYGAAAHGDMGAVRREANPSRRVRDRGDPFDLAILRDIPNQQRLLAIRSAARLRWCARDSE